MPNWQQRIAKGRRLRCQRPSFPALEKVQSVKNERVWKRKGRTCDGKDEGAFEGHGGEVSLRQLNVLGERTGGSKEERNVKLGKSSWLRFM